MLLHIAEENGIYSKVEEDIKKSQLQVQHISSVDALGTLGNKTINYSCLLYDVTESTKFEDIKNAVNSSYVDKIFLLTSDNASYKIINRVVEMEIQTEFFRVNENVNSNIFIQRLKNFIESSDIDFLDSDDDEKPTAILNENLDVIFINESQPIFESSRYSSEKILGKNLSEISENDTSRIESKFREALEEQKEVQFVDYSKFVDGWVEFTVQPGDEKTAVVNAVDVSEKHEKERKKHLYKIFVQNIEDGAFMLDTNMEFKFVNQRFCEVTGISESEIIGQSPYNLVENGVISSGDIDGAIQVIQRLLSSARNNGESSSESVKMTLHTDHLPQDEIFLDVRFSVFELNGRIDGVVGVARDITEQKTREEMLKRQNERLEKFANIISHDLRNPLGVASGYIEQTQESQDLSYLSEAENALDRMENIIEDILTLAREGRDVKEMKKVNLHELIQSCSRNVDDFQGYDYEIMSGTPEHIMADPSRLKSIVENLFRNSVEHTEESTKIYIGGNDNEFYIADNGPGIPDDLKDKVIESGYTTQESGTGFGLAIVREVAEAHNWEFKLDDHESGGAKFRFLNVNVVDSE